MADNKTLDIAGDWDITYGYTSGARFGTDASGHFIPAGHPLSTQTYRVHFDLVGPGDHGGHKYSGTLKDWPGTYLAETYYNQQGVQLLNMVSQLDGAIELHCGIHYPFYKDDPNGVYVLGSWCQRGLSLSERMNGGPNHRRPFAMQKLKRTEA